jgi:hypothetical protein
VLLGLGLGTRAQRTSSVSGSVGRTGGNLVDLFEEAQPLAQLLKRSVYG